MSSELCIIVVFRGNLIKLFNHVNFMHKIQFYKQIQKQQSNITNEIKGIR